MISRFRQHKSLTLLVSLMLLMLVYPFFEMSRLGSVVYTLLFTATLLAGVYAISYDVRYIAGGMLMAAPILVCHWSNFILGSPMIEVMMRVCTTVFMIYTIFALLKRVLTASRVGFDEIFGAISAYTMIGIVFGFLYLLLERVSPGSFALHGSPPDVATFVYFSFVALSTCGFGDITATAPFARAVVVIEIVTGVSYVAVLIGRLISASELGAGASSSETLQERRENEARVNELLAEARPLRHRPVALVLACVMINYVSSIVILNLGLPFFLDSWGTSLAVILGGLVPGIVTAVLYHVIIAWFHWGWGSWVWTFSSLMIAGLTCVFSRKGWLRLEKPVPLIGAGILAGFLNGILAQLIILAAHLPAYQGTLPVYRFFYKMTSNVTFAALAEKMFVEIADKTICLMMAAGAVYLFHDLLAEYKKSLRPSEVSSK